MSRVVCWRPPERLLDGFWMMLDGVCTGGVLPPIFFEQNVQILEWMVKWTVKVDGHFEKSGWSKVGFCPTNGV